MRSALCGLCLSVQTLSLRVCVCVCVCVCGDRSFMCFCGLKASPLLCLCGITLGSCPLSDPTVFMRKQQEGFILLSSSSSSSPPPPSPFCFLPPSCFVYILLTSLLFPHSPLSHPFSFVTRSSPLLSISYPFLFLDCFPSTAFPFFFPGELSSRLLSSFLFSLLPSSLFGSRVFYIPHTLPPLFNCLVIISLLLTSSTSFSPLFSTLLFSHFFPSSQLALPRSFSEPLSSFSFLSPLLRNVVQFQTDLNTFQIFGCFFVFCF